MCDTVASQLVSHETKRFPPLTLYELPEESPCRTPVPTGLYEDIDHIAILINSPPQILSLTVDFDEDFVQMPCIAEPTLSSSQLASVVRTELPAPLSHGFVRHDDTSFGKQIFDLPETQTELIIGPHSVADDFRWKTMPEVAGSMTHDPASLPDWDLT